MYIENFLSEQDIKEFKTLCKSMQQNEINIVCIGLYNHGKSTLLNVLIEDFELRTFKTADSRETIKNKTIKYNGILYIDTPGLNAKKEDDEKVMDVIQTADIILFVHTITTGELNQKEVEFLEKIQRHWSNPQDFIDRTVFVLSRIDNIEDDEDIAKTTFRVQEQVQNIFNYSCLVAPVSAIDYKDGMIDDEIELIEDSNIQELKKLIELLSENTKEIIIKTKQIRVEERFDVLVDKLYKKIEINQQKMDMLKVEQQKMEETFFKDIKQIESTLKSMYQRLEDI